MNYIAPVQIAAQLRGGQAVEQWLGHTNAKGYRSIKWLRIERDRNDQFCVAILECFDDGSPDFLDIYAFEPLDPDALNGVTKTFKEPEAAIAYATSEGGASIDQFVIGGQIQEIYARFLEQNGTATEIK
jgi:hypothetical protein